MTVDAAARLARLREKMKDTGTDLVALGPGSYMQWVLGFHTHADERPCLLLIGPERETFLMPSLNAEGARAETSVGFHTWTDADGPQTALSAALAEVGAGGVRKVAIDETMRADFALLALEAVRNALHSYASETVGALRLLKDATEYALLKMNAGIADRAMLKAFAAIRPGMTEVELAGVVKGHFGAEGASAEFWIVGAGGNGAYPHHSASERKLATGDAVVIDIGGRKGGYPSDLTRMAAVGHAPEGYAEVHAIVEAAVVAALAAAKPGVRAHEVDAAARGVITKAGYGPYFVHRTGHGLGIDGHEPPYLTASSDTVLEEGMVFSIEPGIYLPGRFGIRLEEIVILRADGPEILSDLPRTLHVAAG